MVKISTKLRINSTSRNGSARAEGRPNATKLIVAVIVAIIGVTAVSVSLYFTYSSSQISNTSNVSNGGLALSNNVQDVLPQQGSTVTTSTVYSTTTVISTATLVSTTTSSTTETVTQTVTAPPPSYYIAVGKVTMGIGYQPTMISFKCGSLNAISNPVNGSLWYQAQLPNLLTCTVSAQWTSSSVPPFNGVSNCSQVSFAQVVGAGSSPIRMDWAC